MNKKPTDKELLDRAYNLILQVIKVPILTRDLLVRAEHDQLKNDLKIWCADKLRREFEK